MNSKVVYFIIPLLILVSGFSLMLKLAPAPAMELQRFGSNVQAMSLEAPSYLDFAGERVPVERMEVKSRLEREIKRYSRGLHGKSILAKRVSRYRAQFTETLSDYGVPADFFFLSMIESNLSNAISPAGAAGFWQLMPETARRYGLEVNEEIDERLNVDKATVAAARYLRDLHKEFNSWTLVAAAYNRGENGLLRQIENQENSDYFSLDLNRETSRYIYRALALKLLIDSPERYGLEFAQGYRPVYSYSQVIEESIENIPLYILENEMDPVAFRQLNPWILHDYLNVNGEKNYTLEIPVGDVHAPELAVAEGYFDIAFQE
jgi:membrane-bound lytic murein transglycosylase D